MNGIDTLHALKRAKISVRVIILTSFETDEDIYRAVQAGAQGYLLKDAPQSRHDGCHPGGSRGQAIFSTTDRCAAGRTHDAHKPHRPRTRGLQNARTGASPTSRSARALDISGNTVRNHVNSIIEKLEVSDRTEAATTAIHRGIIEVNN